MSYRWERRPSVASRLLPILGLGLLAGLAVALALNSPRLAAQAPPAGAAAVSSLAPITLTFNRPMDAASVQERLSVEPALPGQFALEAGGTLAQFTPGQPWPAGSVVTVTLRAGARSAAGLPLLFGRRWQFTVGRPRVAYLSEAGGPPEVWAVPAEGGQAERLTQTALGVLDFSVSPDAQRLAYAAVTEGGSDLRVLALGGGGDALLLACPGETCRAPQWSPDGAQVAFERSARPGEIPHVWLLDLAGGAAHALAPEADETREARWSPDGARLAYYDKTAAQIVVNDLATGALTRIDNASGEMAAWTPDGLALLFPDIIFTAEPAGTAAPGLSTPTPAAVFGPSGYYSHLVRVGVDAGTKQELSGEPAVEDATAAPAPGGDWLAFGRKFLDAARWTPGRQLWLMRADGTQARALTQEGDFQHSGFAWSADGQRLAFIRFDVTQPGTPPEVWVLEPESGEARRLAESGTLPAWLP